MLSYLISINFITHKQFPKFTSNSIVERIINPKFFEDIDTDSGAPKGSACPPPPSFQSGYK